MDSLVISLTTIHSRIHKIHHVVDSLLKQESDLAFKVCLFVSEEAYLLDHGVSELPEKLLLLQKAHGEQFEIIYTENIGPYRKFLPILKDFFEDRIDFKYLVTVDDDTVYPPSWLNNLVRACEIHDCVVAYRGRKISCDEEKIHRYKKWSHSNSAILKPSLKTVGTGKDGIIYKPEYFHPDVIDIDSALKVCSHADDLWLKMHTSINGVATVLLSESLSAAFTDLGTEDENTLYRKINKFGGNDRAVENLIAYFLTRYDLNLLDVFNCRLSSSSTWRSKTFLNSYL